MTTNILAIPQLPVWDEPFVVVTGSDFREVIQFLEPGDGDVPLAITGVEFAATIRSADDTTLELIKATTQAGTLIVEGAEGKLSFAVPASATERLQIGEAIGDIVAMADGVRINLCAANGPQKFVIRAGLA